MTYRKVSWDDIKRLKLEHRTNNFNPEHPDYFKHCHHRAWDESLEMLQEMEERWLQHIQKCCYVGPPCDCSKNDPRYTSEYLAKEMELVGIYSDPTDISNLEV